MLDENFLANKKQRAMNRQDGRKRLLDAAECLFADYGFDGVSVRLITKTAGTRLAEVNDLFGGKLELFQAVLNRRAPLITEDRKNRLELLPHKGEPRVRVEALVDAFALPLLLRAREGEGWLAYFRLLAILHTTRSPALLHISDHFLPTVHAYRVKLCTIFPHWNDHIALSAYGFLVSSVLSIFSDNRRLDFYSGGRVSSVDFDTEYSLMRTFVVGGLLALAERNDI